GQGRPELRGAVEAGVVVDAEHDVVGRGARGCEAEREGEHGQGRGELLQEIGSSLGGAGGCTRPERSQRRPPPSSAARPIFEAGKSYFAAVTTPWITLPARAARARRRAFRSRSAPGRPRAGPSRARRPRRRPERRP